MTGKKISVIIPAYNVEKYIRRCLDSVVSQTYENLEIIVINDGSTDRTGEIAGEYAEQFPDKVFLYDRENGGQAAARNFGIEKATGEYIGFVDSDDFASASMYERLYCEAEQSGCDIVTCGYFGCDVATGIIRGYQAGYRGEFNQSIYENPLILRVNSPYPWNKLYRADLLRRAGFRFPEGMIFEDLGAVIPLFLDAERVGRVHEKLYYYMKGRKGGTLSVFDERHGQIIDALKIVNDAYRKRGEFERFYDTLLFFNIRHIFARFDEMKRYRDEAFKQAFTERAYELLDSNFPGWRESDTYAEFRSGGEDEGEENAWADTEEVPGDGKRAHGAKKKRKKDTGAGQNGAQKEDRAGGAKTKAEYFERLIAERRIVKGAVLIKCFHGNDIRGACYYIGKLLAADSEREFIVYVAAMDAERVNKFRSLYGGDWNIVDMGSDRYVELLATAEYIVTNRGVVDFYRKRKGQKFIFTDFMPSVLGQGREVTYGAKNMQGVQFGLAQADAILFPSELRDEFLPLLARYSMNEICQDKAVYVSVTEFFREWGTCLPEREDGLVRVAYLPALQVLPGLEDAKYYLFLSELRKKLTALDERMEDDRKLLVVFPRAVLRQFRANIWKHIEFLSKEDELSEILAGCDGLIGEYSSELYVMRALGRPVCRFVTHEPDVAWSQGIRGETDFDVFESAEQVAQWVNGIAAWSGDAASSGNGALSETAIRSRSGAEVELVESANRLRGLDTYRQLFYRGRVKKNRRQRRAVVYVPDCRDKHELDEFVGRHDRSRTLFFVEKRKMDQAMASWLRAWGPELKYVVIIRNFVISREESRYVKYRLTTKEKLKEKRDKERYGA